MIIEDRPSPNQREFENSTFINLRSIGKDIAELPQDYEHQKDGHLLNNFLYTTSGNGPEIHVGIYSSHSSLTLWKLEDTAQFNIENSSGICAVDVMHNGEQYELITHKSFNSNEGEISRFTSKDGVHFAFKDSLLNRESINEYIQIHGEIENSHANIYDPNFVSYVDSSGNIKKGIVYTAIDNFETRVEDDREIVMPTRGDIWYAEFDTDDHLHIVGSILQEEHVPRPLHIPVNTKVYHEDGTLNLNKSGEWGLEGPDIQQYEHNGELYFVLKAVGFPEGERTARQQEFWSISRSVNGPYTPFACLTPPNGKEGETGHGSHKGLVEDGRKYIVNAYQWRKADPNHVLEKRPEPAWHTNIMKLSSEEILEIGIQTL